MFRIGFVLRGMFERIPFALEDVTNISFGDEMVIALEPMVPMLPDVGRVVTGFNGTDVVDHSKKRIPGG